LRLRLDQLLIRSIIVSGNIVPAEVVLGLFSSIGPDVRRWETQRTLQRSKSRCELFPVVRPDPCGCRVCLGFGVGESVDTDRERRLGRNHTSHLSLELLRCTSDQRGVVDEPVLGGIVLGLERSEQGLFGTQDLDGTGGELGQVVETSGVADQSRTDKFADNGGQVGRHGFHPVGQVLRELFTVLGDRDDLVAERVDVVDIRVGNFRSHRNLGGGLERVLELFGEDEAKVGRGGVCSETHGLDTLGVSKVVGDDLAHFREMPSVPFLATRSASIRAPYYRKPCNSHSP
jgi:hypothetical protein